jgi:hypothetical protein
MRRFRLLGRVDRADCPSRDVSQSDAKRRMADYLAADQATQAAEEVHVIVHVRIGELGGSDLIRSVNVSVMAQFADDGLVEPVLRDQFAGRRSPRQIHRDFGPGLCRVRLDECDQLAQYGIGRVRCGWRL